MTHHPAPLAHVRQRIDEFDECVELMTRIWGGRGRPAFVGEQFASTVNTLLCGPVTFGDNFCAAGLRIDGLSFPDVHLLTIPLDGVSTHTIGGHTRPATRGMAVLHPVDDPFSAATETDSFVLQVTIDAPTLQREATAFVGVEGSRHIDWTPVFELGPANRSPLGGLAMFMVEQLRTTDFIATRDSQRVTHFANALTQCLIEEQARHWKLPGRIPAVSPAFVILAEEYIRANLCDAITIADLAAVTGVTGRSLQRAFLTHRGTTPLTFQRELRLDEARRRFVADPTATVTAVAMALGFNHIGRFAERYRQRFGELPTETLRRSRPPHSG